MQEKKDSLVSWTCEYKVTHKVKDVFSPEGLTQGCPCFKKPDKKLSRRLKQKKEQRKQQRKFKNEKKSGERIHMFFTCKAGKRHHVSTKVVSIKTPMGWVYKDKQVRECKCTMT